MVVDRLRTGRLASFSPTASPPLAERHSLLQQQQWSPSYRLLPHGDTAARRLVRNGNASGHLVDRSPAHSTDVALTVPAPEEILPKALPLSLCDTLRKKCSPCSSSSFSLPYPHLFDQCDLVLVCCAFSVLLLFHRAVILPFLQAHVHPISLFCLPQCSNQCASVIRSCLVTTINTAAI